MTHALPLWTIRSFEPISWKWLRHTSIIVLLSLSLILMGCSFASFVAAAEEDIPTVISMISNITNIVAPGVSVAIQALGVTALAALAVACGNPAPGAATCDATSLIGQYQVASDPATKATLLQKIQAALTAVNTNLNSIIAIGRGIPTSVGTAIVTAVSLALSTVSILISLIPVAIKAVNGNMSEKAALSSAQKSGVVVQYPEHANSLKKKYNAAVGQLWPTAVVR